MDRLIHHCLREIAFDGDFGSNVSRLRDFINSFYSVHSSTPQSVDEGYCTFFWSLLVQHPSVKIGTVPQGQPADVYIPKQPRAAKKQELSEDRVESPAVGELEKIPDATSPLSELTAKYGDRLRIAVDSETCLLALTGSHTRPAKLSDMVYATLQLIARERDTGISMLDLGKKSGYDQKTCFYLVKQLTELDLVLKLRREGNTMNFCVHKYFYENSPSWRKIREEEDAARNEETENADATGVEEIARHTLVQFEPMDKRALSSLTVLRSRVVKLLENSENNVFPMTNIAPHVGFRPTCRTDRRFFTARLRELIAEGTVEKVLVPTTRSQGVPCLRLVPLNERLQDSREGKSIIPDNVVDEAEEDMLFMNENEPVAQLQANKSIHAHLLDCLEEAGMSGATVNDLHERLGSFDKRAIELLLTRLEKRPPPAHLADRAVVQVMENFGRERRHRFFLLVHYASLLAKEGIEDASAQYPLQALNQTGEFMEIDPSNFYDSLEELRAFQDSMQSVIKRKIGASRSKHFVNPILPDGTIKRGRPRKDGGTAAAPKKSSKKAGSASTKPTDTQEKANKAKRKRGKVETEDAPDLEKTEEERRPHKRGRKKNDEDAGEDLVAQELSKDVVNVDTSLQQFSSDDINVESAGNEAGDTSTHDGAYHETGPSSEVTNKDAQGNVKGVQQAKRGRKRKDPNVAQAKPTVKKRRGSSKNPRKKTKVTDADIAATIQVEPNPALDHENLEQQTPTEDPAVLANLPSEMDTSEGDRAAETASSKDAVDSNAQPEIQIDPELIRESSKAAPPADAPQLTTTLIPSQTATASKAPKQLKDFEGVRKNLSMARRENEFMRLLEEAGGITNTSGRTFSDAHMALLEELTKSKEPTSAPPGTRTDRRTMITTLTNLEEQGKIKLLTTTAPLGSSSDSIVKIAYLPRLNQEAVDEFVVNLHKVTPVIPQIKRMDVQTKLPVVVRSAAHGKALEWITGEGQASEEGFERNPDRAVQLFSQPDEVVREVLLLEKQTVSQLFGYVVGSVQRLRLLHLHLLSLFESDTEVPYVLSKEYRVVASEYFEHSIPLSLVCKIVMTLEYRDELRDLLANATTQNTPISKLSEKLKAVLAIGRSRLRRRIARLLQSLSSLGLVIPLRRTESATALVQFPDGNGINVAFEQCTFNLKLLPTHWRVSTVAPLYSVADSRLPPQFIEDSPLLSEAQGVLFWGELKRCSIDEEYVKQRLLVSSPASAVPLHYTQQIITVLRRTNHWKCQYALTWYQQRFLDQFVEATTRAPASEDSNATLQRLSHVISAPVDVVKEYCSSALEAREYALEKAQKRASDVEKRIESRKRRDAKMLLSKRGKEARQQRAEHWEEMVQQCVREHEESLSSDGSLPAHLKRLRQSYLHGNKMRDDHYWCKEITKVLTALQHSAEMQRLFPSALVHRPAAPAMLPPAQPASKVSVNDLITLQSNIMRASEESKAQKKSKKSKKKMAESGEDTAAVVEGSRLRRRRFHWSDDFDELLLDAAAIIKARCRNTRLDWSALEQVFPHVPRNSARQRLVHLRENSGTDSYCKRLEDCWHDLWLKHRGTTYLPDLDWHSSTNFDLVAHIEFLRRYVDKAAIRVGLTTDSAAPTFDLPQNIEEIVSQWEVNLNSSAGGSSQDILWSTAADEARERTLVIDAFVLDEKSTANVEKALPESAYVADAALKMVFGTPASNYDEENASQLLRSVGEARVASASARLLEQGVLSKVVRDKKRDKPGRRLQISDANQNALYGPFSPDIFADAYQCEKSYKAVERQWNPWPLLSSDGDLAALIEMVSDNEVEFDFETERTRGTREQLDWNSKKAADDDIEIEIKFQLKGELETSSSAAIPYVSRSQSNVVAEFNNTADEEHGQTVAGDDACCYANSDDVVDCKACLGHARKLWLETFGGEEREHVERLMQDIANTGGEGATIEEIMMNSSLDRDRILAIIEAQIGSAIPLVYIVGYNCSRIVSAEYIGNWTVRTASEEGIAKTFPRRWKDIHGEVVNEQWYAACRAVLGMVFVRPGSTFVDLHRRLRLVYDRQELLELLGYLEQEGYIERRTALTSVSLGRYLGLLESDLKRTFWFVRANKRWYDLPELRV